MDANQLDELERLFKKAAPGWALDSPDADDPWWVDDDAPVSFVTIYRGRSLGTVVVGNIVSRASAKLIAAARNALPELIAAARELERTRSMLTNYEETAALVRSQQLSMAERDELAQLRRDLAAAREEVKGNALLAMAVHETFDLIANSSGVAGLHLNGDEAPWDELLEGGEYEKWLRSLSQAKAWLDAESAEARKGVTPTTGAQQ